MKFTSTLVSAGLVVAVASVPIRRNVDPALVPDLGFTAGKNPTGTGDCDGAVNGADGKPIKIPCSCPPDRQTFITALNKDVAAGHAVNNPSVKVSFPTDDSVESQQARINAASVTLQNLNGPGKGCPIVSTTLSAQSKALQDGDAVPAPSPNSVPAAASTLAKAAASSSAAAAPSAASLTPSTTVDPALVPDLGFTAGKNPTGTGDCDGAVNGADGKPIKIPCSCPPDRQTFINALSKDVAAGHAINNPSVKISFPTDNSVSSQQARINAAAVTLQNLNGPGKGCPIVSTTLSAQSKAIQNGGTVPPKAGGSRTKSAGTGSGLTTPGSPPASAVASSPAAASPSAASGSTIDPALVPNLGFTAGKNPTGTGDCDGAVNGADGTPIKIPCACPPDRQTFINALSKDVAAGHAVNNPSVKVSFPTDDKVASQEARINTALVTLQNLNGPGKGCPAASTTLSAQLKALQNGST